MSITFQAPNSSATPVAWALAELNPNGKVPTLVADGVSGFEALAIMLWLSDCYGVDKGLWPAPSDPLRLHGMAWGAWAYVTFAAVLSRRSIAIGMGADVLKNPVLAEHTRAELDDLHAMLARKLSAQPFLLGSTFTMADLIVSAAIGFGHITAAPIAHSRTHLLQWLERCNDRPAHHAVLSA